MRERQIKPSEAIKAVRAAGRRRGYYQVVQTWMDDLFGKEEERSRGRGQTEIFHRDCKTCQIHEELYCFL